MPDRVSIAFPVPLRRTFSYSVPARWREKSLVGCRATAPLGGRTLSGVVVEDDPEVPEGITLREVTSILDDEPSIGAELLESTRILAERFFAPWGELLRAALPARLPSGEGTRYEITGAGAAAVFDAPRPDRLVLEQLLESGRVAAPALAEIAEGGRDGIRALELRGWIRPVGAVGREPKRQVLVSLLAHGEDARNAAGRSKKAAEALRFLESLGRTALSEELGAAGFSPALVRKLAEKGAVSLVSRDRRPDDAGAVAPLVPASPFRLSPDQARALATVEAAVAAREFFPSLLFGVTGSGKTEIYLRAIASARSAGRGAVWLVPEIALTPIFARSLRERFGDEAVVLHSAVGEANRARAWKDMKEGRARVVIGPRSAVFSPIDDIGIFIVDEEHDASYKQDESPHYDARDAAAIRAQAHGAVLLLGSATPALETWHASAEGRIRRLDLPERIEGRPLPDVVVVDLRREPSLPEEKGIPLFSRPLAAALAGVFDRGEQAIILAPRRGYAPFLLCRACGNAFPCPHCSVSAVVHRRENALRCHYCGSRRPLPARCDVCGGKHLEAVGAGTERAAERFAALFPGVRFAVLDSDTARQRGGAAAVVSSMENGNVQALIGTQMVAKGHHFPNVTAIGVLSADTILNFPDFRAAEKTFQLIAQVAGRSGRGERKGLVLVQTFHPENPAIQAALTHDAAGFSAGELEFRKTFFYPPFSEMAEILVASTDRERASAAAAHIAEALLPEEALRVTPAAAAPLERLAGKWRFQVLVRSRSRKAILAALLRAIPDSPPSGVAVSVDVDPRNLM